MLILTERHLRAALTMRDVIEAVEGGFRALARQCVNVPERLRLDVPSENGVMLEMPALVHSENKSENALGTKIVSVFENNAARGLDVVQAVYLLLNVETGAPLALMEGRFITAIRTAATSAVATKFMAARGPKWLAVFGAGVQARFHIEAMIEVASVEKILICSRTTERASALADESNKRYGMPCEVVSAKEAASNANLICACTTAAAPLFDGNLIKPGTHINAVGAFTATTRELDTEAVRRARVIIDENRTAGREAGEILIPLQEGAIESSHIKGTLADLVSGKVAGRESEDEITLFKSCGLAIEDLVTARLAYQRATMERIGLRVDF
ncbi:MAG TPA: ornithine cyclodeaminase family protein [Blastocatellia bacterium]|nr:ornithine cyclodeaminase family protein [Blastocatellia bacterium]